MGQVIPQCALVAAGMHPHGRQPCATGIGFCFIHRGLGVQGYTLLSQSRRQCRVVGSGAQVHQGGDRQARVQRREGSAIGRVIAGEDYQWLLGCHAVMHQQAPQGTAQHDARQVVVAEHHRLLAAAGGEHAGSGPDLEQALALEDRQIMIAEPGVAGGLGEHPDTAVGCHRRAQLFQARPGFGARGVEAVVGEGAPQVGVFIDQQHLGAPLSGGQGRTESGGSRANDSDITEQVLLVAVRRLRLQVGDPEPGGGADEALPEMPDAQRFEKSAVVETHRQEAPQLVQQAEAIVVQAAPVVLSGDYWFFFSGQVLGQSIRCLGGLDQGIGIVTRQGQGTPGSMVFKGPGQQPAVFAQQGRDHRVPGIAADGFAFKGEGHRALPINVLPEGRRQAPAGHDSPSGILKSTRSVNSSPGS